MKKEALALDQPFRIRRLQELLDHEDFGGNKAALGRFIGYQSGAYVRQMLAGERPIHETTIEQIEAAHGGKYAGWFAKGASPSAPAMQLAKLFDERVPEPLRQATYAAIVSQIDLAVAVARAAAKEMPAPSPTPVLDEDR